MRWLALVVLSFALVGAGCGGGSDESAATTETTAAETTTTELTSTEDTTDTSGGTTGTFNWASKDCQNMVKAFVGLSAAVGAASSGQDVSPDIQRFSKYVEEVPEEIRADVQTIAAGYKEFVAKLKDIGYTAGQVPTADQLAQLQEASKSVSDPDVKAASERLTAWTQKNCT